MKFGASYDYGVLTSQFTAKCDWGVAPLPAKPKTPNTNRRIRLHIHRI